MISVAVVHHAALAPMINALREVVAPGGTLLVQDVVRRSGIQNLPANALGWALRRGRRLLGREPRRASVDALYAKHGAREHYLESSGVAAAYRDLLPGARIHHHLEWRYTVVWKRGPGNA